MGELTPEPEGVKRLTLDNWLEGDDAIKAFRRLSPEGQQYPLTQQDLAEGFLSIDVSPGVPTEIKALFRRAQAVCVYGYFFYPFYALGLEELARVGEAAIVQRFEDEDGPKTHQTFARRVAWLHGQGVLDAAQRSWWDSIRQLRNMASHPEMQTLIAPGEVRGDLRRIAHAISCLFDESLEFGSVFL
jgi:hypothetical protein